MWKGDFCAVFENLFTDILGIFFITDQNDGVILEFDGTLV